MPTRTSLLLLLAITFFVHPCWALNNDSCAAALLPQQEQALLHAQSGDYEVSVLRGTVRGEPKTVVLLGEKHVKDLQAKLAGQELVRLFPLRGLEGIYVDSTWGGRFLKWTILAATLLNKVFTLGARQHDSTIDDAIRHSRLFKGAEQLSDPHLNLSSVTIEEREMSAHDVVQELGLKSLADLPSLPTPKNLPLELGHKPGLTENLQSVLLPAQLFSCGVGFCIDTFGSLEPMSLSGKNLSSVLFGMAAISATQALGARYLRDGFGHQRWYQVLFAIPNGLIHGRDNTMTENIIQSLINYPEHAQMLVIVGASHVRGIKRLLNQQHAFQEVPLP